MSTFWWFIIIYVIGLIVTPFIIYYSLCIEYKKKKDNGTLSGWETTFDYYLEHHGEFFNPTIMWPLILIIIVIGYIGLGIKLILKQIRKKTGVDK